MNPSTFDYTSRAKQDPSRIEALVKDMRAHSNMSGLPSTFHFSADGKRLYFLADTSGFGAEIHYVSINEEDSVAQLEWTPLLPNGDHVSTASSEPLPKEEALRRERMRASLGLHTFSYQPETSQILVPAAPTWFIFNTSKDPSKSITELQSPIGGVRLDAKLSPSGKLVSFVRDNDLWVQSLSSLEETRITFTATESNGTYAGHKASGVAEYCMQEEFDRYTGYWWSPKVQDGSKQRMLYVTTDETHVTTYNISTAGIRGEVDKFVYPLAGDANATFSLSIAEIDSTVSRTKPTVALKHLNPSLKTRFPWVEYIPRLGFSPDGSKIWVQLLDRKQQHYMLVSININQFTTEQPADDSHLWNYQKSTNASAVSTTTTATSASSTIPEEEQAHHRNYKTSPSPSIKFDPTSPLMTGIQLLHCEHTYKWINITDILYWYSDGSDRLIVASEVCDPKDNNDMRHLYLLTPTLDGTDASGGSVSLYQRKAITEGDNWQVDTNQIVVDETHELVYFTGTKDSPLECHLYVASTSPSAPEPAKNVHRMTPNGCYHSVVLNHDATGFVTCYSNIREPHRVQYFSISLKKDGQTPAFPPSASLSCTLARSITQSKPSFDINPPEFFNFKNSHGETIYGCYYKPRHFDPSRKYPTILKVYGGPHVQYVTNDYKMTRQFLNLQLYAHLGFLVVIIDGVGSWRRGLKFEGYLRNCMGTVEVQEQVEGLTHLIKSGIVDPERIGVTGWSYGGYLSLLCLAQRPDFFKLAVSGAPVTTWESYDTAYTERYMDTPEYNLKGYKMGSVFQYVPTMPDQPNRLLLIHGNLDENVHICNTFELIQHMIDHNKPYQLQVFPNERHGVRNPQSAKYQELTSLRFFLEHL